MDISWKNKDVENWVPDLEHGKIGKQPSYLISSGSVVAQSMVSWWIDPGVVISWIIASTGASRSGAVSAHFGVRIVTESYWVPQLCAGFPPIPFLCRARSTASTASTAIPCRARVLQDRSNGFRERTGKSTDFNCSVSEDWAQLSPVEPSWPIRHPSSNSWELFPSIGGTPGPGCDRNGSDETLDAQGLEESAAGGSGEFGDESGPLKCWDGGSCILVAYDLYDLYDLYDFFGLIRVKKKSGFGRWKKFNRATLQLCENQWVSDLQGIESTVRSPGEFSCILEHGRR